jgi:hypothetical protein
MKTRNNIQKTVLEKVRRNALYGLALFICTTFIHTTITASNLKQQCSLNSNKCQHNQNVSEAGASQANAGFYFIEYHAQDFVEAEMAEETDCFLNCEAIDVELFQIEAYDAANFVKAELASETENFVNGNAGTLDTLISFQVQEYRAQDFVDSEMKTEYTSWMSNENSGVSTDKLVAENRVK